MELLKDIALTFLVSLAAAIIVTLVYNIYTEGIALVDWKTSFTLAIILGIVLPVSRAAEKKNRLK